MPRGEIEHLKKTQFKPQWSQRTVVVRLPVHLVDKAKKIVEWGDRQPNPQQSLQRLLDIIETFDGAQTPKK